MLTFLAATVITSLFHVSLVCLAFRTVQTLHPLIQSYNLEVVLLQDRRSHSKAWLSPDLIDLERTPQTASSVYNSP